MNTFDAINDRRSIRKFLDKEVPREIIDQILKAAIAAPSAKNRQPWKFIVVTNKEKAAMINAMREGIENEKKSEGIFPDGAKIAKWAEYTMQIMEQAPITIFVFNTEENYLWREAGIENKLFDITNIQSIGAAIQNMLLAATDLGVGSLWICDVFFAYRELCAWLNEKNQMIAAVSLGWADESPNPRHRKNPDDIIEWR